jgi:acyl-coenzyme A synthetase/AMP-(fatty) acid ligase/REP element-mobilizing transposase RayT
MNDQNLLEDQPIAWTPTPEVIERAQLTKFMKQVGLSTWDELYEFSIRDVEKFTEEVLKFLDIKFDPPYEKLLDTSNGVEMPTWLCEGGLNITDMCLDRWQTDEMKDQLALIAENEDDEPQELTFGELLQEVEEVSEGLRLLGFGQGDAIGIHLPMMIETVVALLAINRIGAVAVPVFSGYGVEAISSRLNSVKAKALFTCEGFSRRGKIFDAFHIAQEAVANSPTVETIIVVERMVGESWVPDERAADHEKAIFYHELVDSAYRSPRDEWPAEEMCAEDPLIILYTSGTTGKPKGIAHTHASFPIKAAQDMAFGTDVGKSTRICWYTDIGWMMGPWLIYGALINGATICIYDGAPDYPTPDRMWEFCAKHKVEVLGISPTLIRSLAAAEGSADTPVRVDAASAFTNDDAGGRRGWYRHKLPHYDGNVTQFITFRLADSLPQAVVEKMKYRLDHDKVVDYSQAFRDMVEDFLDAGSGECILANPEVAKITESTILHEHRTSCHIIAWVVMPNHVHVLLRPIEGHALAEIMKRIKGVSARKINQLLGRNGSIWQADYFDRYIRDEDDRLRKVQYIENNPVAAKLIGDASLWKYSSASRTADAPVRMSAKHENDTQSPSDSDTTQGPSDEPILAGGTGDADKSVRAPFERHDLSPLRIFASTGEPWNPAPWWWLFEKVGNSKLPIINYSGGTEIAGGILMGNPLLPIKPCSFPAPCPGMDVDILDDDGKPVEDGKVGELVIKQPWIGMARGFWQEKERYLDTYWRRFKDIWVHGDFAMRDKDGHWFILGRSDDTLKVAGKRVGPAEVESLLVAHPLVTEAAVIGVPDEVKGTAMVAFVVLNNESNNEEKSKIEIRNSRLASELCELVARDMGKPLAPSKIHFVSALPKTRNAKVMRRVIRSAYLGEDPGDLSALEDPKSVEAIANAKE